MKLLICCTGNTCRSPMAQEITLVRWPGLEIESRACGKEHVEKGYTNNYPKGLAFGKQGKGYPGHGKLTGDAVFNVLIARDQLKAVAMECKLRLYHHIPQALTAEDVSSFDKILILADKKKMDHLTQLFGDQSKIVYWEDANKGPVPDPFDCYHFKEVLPKVECVKKSTDAYNDVAFYLWDNIKATIKQLCRL